MTHTDIYSLQGETISENPSNRPNTISSEKKEEKTPSSPNTPKLDPTRYGDWEKNGRCIDF